MNFIYLLKNNQSGQLLIEVIVVIGIIALLSTISIPLIARYQPNLKLSATARDMTSDLRYAQQLTVSEQVVHKVRFNIGTDSYDVLRVGAVTTIIKSVVFNEVVSFQDVGSFTDDTVVFNYYGGVSESDSIVLINSNNETATINIKPSGYVMFEE